VLVERGQAYIGEQPVECGLVVQIVKSMLGCHTGHLIVMLIVGNFQVAQSFLLVALQ